MLSWWRVGYSPDRRLSVRRRAKLLSDCHGSKFQEMRLLWQCLLELKLHGLKELYDCINLYVGYIVLLLRASMMEPVRGRFGGSDGVKYLDVRKDST